MTSPTLEFKAYDPETDSVGGRPPRILDIDGFEALHEVTDISEETLNQIAITDEQEDYSEYPQRTWKVLRGCKSWRPADRFNLDHASEKEYVFERIRDDDRLDEAPLGYTFNIERVGIAQEGEDGYWRDFFSTVSEYTQPFQFYASARVNSFPDVRDFDDGSEVVYVVTCVDGDLRVQKEEFERTSSETIVDETEDGELGDFV